MGILSLHEMRRRTIPAPRNPMDKSTVVSIFPKGFDEQKPTIQPGRFIMEPGSYDTPAILVVGSSSWWREIDEEQPLLEIPNSSVQVASAIVRDFCNGLLACDMGSSMPGLFWVPGEFSAKQIKEIHVAALLKARINQTNWFQALVRLADALWARTNGNPLTISDDMRMAAKELNLNNKDWLKDFTMMAQVRCIACGSPRNPDFPVCPTCHAIADPVKASALGIQFAANGPSPISMNQVKTN